MLIIIFSPYCAALLYRSRSSTSLTHAFLKAYLQFLCKELQSFIWLKYHRTCCSQLWLINYSDANILLISWSQGEKIILSKYLFLGRMLSQVLWKTWNKQNFLNQSYLACANIQNKATLPVCPLSHSGNVVPFSWIMGPFMPSSWAAIPFSWRIC